MTRTHTHTHTKKIDLCRMIDGCVRNVVSNHIDILTIDKFPRYLYSKSTYFLYNNCYFTKFIFLLSICWLMGIVIIL